MKQTHLKQTHNLHHLTQSPFNWNAHLYIAPTNQNTQYLSLNCSYVFYKCRHVCRHIFHERNHNIEIIIERQKHTKGKTYICDINPILPDTHSRKVTKPQSHVRGAILLTATHVNPTGAASVPYGRYPSPGRHLQEIHTISRAHPTHHPHKNVTKLKAVYAVSHHVHRQIQHKLCNINIAII